jgi:hypothetical protein
VRSNGADHGAGKDFMRLDSTSRPCSPEAGAYHGRGARGLVSAGGRVPCSLKTENYQTNLIPKTDSGAAGLAHCPGAAGPQKG